MTNRAMMNGATTNGAEIARRVRRARMSGCATVEFRAEHCFGPRLRLRLYELGNGLRVWMLVDRSAPVISYQTWYRVGSRHENARKTGLAHLLEHLMFHGTKHFAYGEFDRLMEQAGAEVNAATWTDWTYYYASLPASGLELAVSLEADRMRHLVLEEETLQAEKEVVQNERRDRISDDVEGMAAETLYKTSFRRHPYGRPTIGWMRDIRRLNLDDCQAFYRTYYAPNNAAVVLVGDFDEGDALRLVRRHYGAYHPASLPEESVRPESPPRKPRHTRQTWPTPTEKALIGYRAPAIGTPEHAALVVLHEILLGGPSSRAQQTLVEERELLSELRGSVTPFRDPGMYEIWASARPSSSVAAAIRELDAIFARVQDHGVSDDELEIAKNQIELGFLSELEPCGGKAEQIGFYDAVLGAGNYVFQQLEDYQRVTREQVREVARKVIAQTSRTIVHVIPAAA